MASPVLVLDSITHAPAGAADPPVVVCGSHGGLAAAVFAVQKRVKGALFNDAGVGKDKAGIAGLELLEKHGILAAGVDAFSARIGLGAETMAGVISHVNHPAREVGVKAGMKAMEAVSILAAASWQALETGDLENTRGKGNRYRETSGRAIRRGPGFQFHDQGRARHGRGSDRDRTAAWSETCPRSSTPSWPLFTMMPGWARTGPGYPAWAGSRNMA